MRTRHQEERFPLRGAACVVEPNEQLLDDMARSLRRMGFSVHETATGAAASFIASNINIEVMLINVALPDANGLQLIRQFRRARPHLRIVALAPGGPWCAPVFDELARFAGADAALAAPASAEAICETVSQLVPSHAPPVEPARGAFVAR
jgi:DNA-binding response OmpR family regulator